MPRVTIGPDWCFSLFKIALVSGPGVFDIYWGLKLGNYWIAVIVAIAFTIEMVSFLITIGQNPGLASRDISIHSKEYVI